MDNSENYLRRIIVPHDLVKRPDSEALVCFHHMVDFPVDTGQVTDVLVNAGSVPILLSGTHRPLDDQFPAFEFNMVSQRFAHNAMQRNQAYKQYGELLGWELRFLGYSILNLSIEQNGRLLFADEPEGNGESMAALWSGLRTEGVALCLELSADRSEIDGSGIDWEMARYPLVSGVPFVSVDYAQASEESIRSLIETERFAGVALVSGLAAADLSGDALVDEAVRLLNLGWHALLVNDLDKQERQSLLAGLKFRSVKNLSAHQDSLARMNKRLQMLQAVEERGKGLIALDRDPDYLLKRRVLSHKLQIRDDYAFQERPARWGSLVRFTYRMRVDGEVMDENQDEGLRTILGKGQVIPGLEQALLGCRKEQALSVEIQPEDAYGLHKEDLIYHIPRSGIFLAPGQKLELGSTATIPRQGEVVHGNIVEINDDTVVVDANHELAGKALQFEIKILDVI